MGKKKLKIAFLSFYSGEIYRGVETYVDQLGNQLVDLGHGVIVYQNGPKRGGEKYKQVVVGLPVDWKGKMASRVPIVPLVGYGARLVARFSWKVFGLMDPKVDVLVTTNGSWQTLLGRIWCWLKGVKLVVAGQSGPGMDDRWNLWCFPDCFVGLTKFHRAWAKRANPLVKCVRIPNGVDLGKFREGVEPLDIGLKKPVVLVAAALEGGKRLGLLIKAVAELQGVSLLLVGRGRLEKKLAKMGERLLGERFKIISLSFDEMPKVYAAADVFSYPTVPWESFGIVLVEAMASGLPVVAAKDPIRKEIVGSAGLLVDPEDTAAYAGALKKALRNKWGDKPRRQAKKFSWERIAKEYEELFEEICS